MNEGDTVTLGGAGWDKIEVTKETWYKAVEVIHDKEVRGVKSPVLKCLLQMGLCPLSIITEDSLMLVNLYGATGGISRIKTPDEYFQLPAYWVNACEIIRLEMNICQKIKW